MSPTIFIIAYEQIIKQRFKFSGSVPCCECNTFICEDEALVGSITTESLHHSTAYSRPCTMKLRKFHSKLINLTANATNIQNCKYMKLYGLVLNFRKTNYRSDFQYDVFLTVHHELTMY